MPQFVELVDVVDEDDRPLAIMPLQEAHKQGLRHRAVFVLLYNNENKIYLQRRSKKKQLYPGRWDLSATGHVQSGESREGAALRELHEELGISLEKLQLRHQLRASAETDWEFITIFNAGRVAAPPLPNKAEVEDGAFHDPDELAFLVEHFREMLTPALLYAFERNLVFPAVME